MADATDFEWLENAATQIDDRGNLPFPVRREIRRELIRRYGDDTGRSIWARAEINSARRVSAIWETAFPTDRAPLDLLATAEDPVRRSMLNDQRFGDVKVLLDDKFELGETAFRSIYAGFAAWAASSNAVNHFDPDPMAASELEIEPVDWDASFFASIAEAGGAVWEDDVPIDDEKRRLFWLWYLREAIPLAISAELNR